MQAWKRGGAILTAGQVKVSPDPRIRLVNGNTLQIRDAVPSDVGDYICQLATFEPREMTHHVEILSKISHVASVAERKNFFSYTKTEEDFFFTLVSFHLGIICEEIKFIISININ